MKEETRKSSSTIFRLILLLALFCATVFFIVNFKLENIDIRSGDYHTEQEIKDELIKNRTDKYTYLLAFRINALDMPMIKYIENIMPQQVTGFIEKIFRKPDIQFVDDVDIEVLDRNSAIIYVYDKKIAGGICHMGTYFYFDREGIIVDTDDELLAGIPEIKGLTPKELIRGQKLDVGRTDLFKDILDILLVLKKNGLAPEDMVFSTRDEITVHIDGHEILLGNNGNYDFKCNNIKNVIASVASDTDEIKYRFDFRNYSEANMEVYATVLNKDF